jgi:hypothetical protein
VLYRIFWRPPKVPYNFPLVVWQSTELWKTCPKKGLWIRRKYKKNRFWQFPNLP